MPAQSPANAACPSVCQTNERFALVASASHQPKRHAAEPQGIRQFSRLFAINAVHEHPGRVGRDGLDFDGVLQHVEQREEIRKRLWVRPEEYLLAAEVSFERQG
jgi:hypothetical protein